MTRVRPRAAFTLVELMLTIAIVGVLLALALPNLKALSLRAKRAELPPNVNGIRILEVARDAELGGFVSAAPYPAEPGKVPVPWIVEESGDFQLIGWNPDGLVRGRYSVEGDVEDFIVRGESDVDGDGVLAVWEASFHDTPHAVTPDSVY